MIGTIIDLNSTREFQIELIELGRWLERNPDKLKHPTEDRTLTYNEAIQMATTALKNRLNLP